MKNLGLQEVDICDDNFNSKMNFNLKILDSIFPRQIIDVVTELPISPNDQDVYILNDGTYSIQIWDGTSWQFLELQNGVIYYILNQNNFLYYDGVDLSYLFSDDILNIDALPNEPVVEDSDNFVFSDGSALKKVNALDLSAYMATKISGGGGGGSGIPSGCVMGRASDNVPPGWLLCDGSQYSRTTYADLFAEIGITHGHGNGTTTFNVPDYRGRVLKMVSGVSNRDPDAATRTRMVPGGNTGNSVGSVQEDMTRMPRNEFYTSTDGEHSHKIPIPYDESGSGLSGARTGRYNTGLYYTTPVSGNHSHHVYGGDNQTTGKNAYINFIIKV